MNLLANAIARQILVEKHNFNLEVNSELVQGTEEGNYNSSGIKIIIKVFRIGGSEWLLALAGIPYSEPNTDLQWILMQSIYQGVKTFESDFACKVGEIFFVELLKLQPSVDCIIAGCSEIPYLLQWLKTSSEKQVKDFLSKLEVIDPVRLALNSTLKSEYLGTVSD